MRSLRWGGGRRAFGESSPPLETINKGPGEARSFTHAPNARASGETRESGKAPLLGPAPPRDLETTRAAPIFPSRPPLPQTDPTPGLGELDPRSAPAAARPQEMLGGGPVPGRRTRAAAAALAPGASSAAGGLRPSRPPARRGRRPAAGFPALTLDLPHLPPERRQKEGSAGSPRGRRGWRQRRPRAAAPYTKGLPARVGALVPAPRAGSHPPAGVCASVHRNAGGGGACGSRAARAGRVGGEGGRAAGAPGALASGAGKAPGGRRASAGRGAGAPAWLQRPARAAPCAPGSARQARSAAGGGRGAGGAGRGRRAGRGLGPRAPAGTGNAPWSARPTGSV